MFAKNLKFVCKPPTPIKTKKKKEGNLKGNNC